MTLLRLPLALLFSALLLPACGGEDEGGPNVDCGSVTVPKFAEVTAFAKCTTCHSAALTGTARVGAPAGINYDNYADAKANATKGMDEVYEGSMPLAGSPALTEAEKTQIYNWASCDTPM
jgi:uncharacterized membrane protein